MGSYDVNILKKKHTFNLSNYGHISFKSFWQYSMYYLELLYSQFVTDPNTDIGVTGLKITFRGKSINMIHVCQNFMYCICTNTYQI